MNKFTQLARNTCAVANQPISFIRSYFVDRKLNAHIMNCYLKRIINSSATVFHSWTLTIHGNDISSHKSY